MEVEKVEAVAGSVGIGLRGRNKAVVVEEVAETLSGRGRWKYRRWKQ